jgi:hypothetical protein
MPGKSKSTTMVRVRLPNEVLNIIERRVENYPGEMTVSGYIRMTLEYMVLRKHVKTRTLTTE